ncbi:MAG: glucose-6-phosphate dehydrogenase (NADP(+)) [Kordiimonadaceae bacterium]|nr:glucose-6-phosphate dehydrogenase (NADP(+)) [Kordiimonadaceae bacterium]
MLDIVIFGGVGDLSLRKLLPALYYLKLDGKLATNSRILCVSRAKIDYEDFLALVEERLKHFINDDFNDDSWRDFSELLQYIDIDLGGKKDWKKLSRCLDITNSKVGKKIIYYFSVPPTIFAPISKELKTNGLNAENTRVVVEKPLGESLKSAEIINDIIRDSFEERQIYRIDHYLGKVPVQNIPKLRFDGGELEEIWNNDHVEDIEITVSETVGVESRAEFLDRAGILRDMVQNHLMQLLTYIAMEKPKSFDADDIRDAKLEVINALCPIGVDNVNTHSIRAQYGSSNGLSSYQDDIKLSKNKVSGTGETYVALKVNIDMLRWHNVPFYLRTGKRLTARFAEIIVNFKDREPLTIPIQPLPVMEKEMRIREAYELLLFDVINGDQTHFVRGDEIMSSWKWIDRIRSAWDTVNMPMRIYPSGSEGPMIK